MTKKTAQKIIHHIDFAFRPGDEQLLEDLRAYAERNNLTLTKSVKSLMSFALEAQSLGVEISENKIYIKKEIT